MERLKFFASQAEPLHRHDGGMNQRAAEEPLDCARPAESLWLKPPALWAV
jgi:hypothetical protein